MIGNLQPHSSGHQQQPDRCDCDLLDNIPVSTKQYRWDALRVCACRFRSVWCFGLDFTRRKGSYLVASLQQLSHVHTDSELTFAKLGRLCFPCNSPEVRISANNMSIVEKRMFSLGRQIVHIQCTLYQVLLPNATASVHLLPRVVTCTTVMRLTQKVYMGCATSTSPAVSAVWPHVQGC